MAFFEAGENISCSSFFILSNYFSRRMKIITRIVSIAHKTNIHHGWTLHDVTHFHTFLSKISLYLY